MKLPACSAASGSSLRPRRMLVAPAGVWVQIYVEVGGYWYVVMFYVPASPLNAQPQAHYCIPGGGCWWHPYVRGGHHSMQLKRAETSGGQYGYIRSCLWIPGGYQESRPRECPLRTSHATHDSGGQQPVSKESSNGEPQDHSTCCNTQGSPEGCDREPHDCSKKAPCWGTACWLWWWATCC